MRSSKIILAVCAVALFVGSTFAVANAFISGTSGQLIKLSSAPPNVAQDQFENTSAAVAFDERLGTTLAAPLTVDMTTAGTYTSFPIGATKIAAGTWVDSHLVHSDGPPHPLALRRAGTVSFPDVILGVIATPKNLAASDSAVGAPGTTYAGNKANRGLDLGQDSIVIAPDLHSVSFDVQTNSALDDFRIVTAHTNLLATTISDAPDPVQADDNVTYTVTVTNGEPYTVPAVQVADAYPGTALVSATAPGGCSNVGTTSTCTLGTLTPGASAFATITVHAPSTVPLGGTTLTNTAKSPPGKDPQESETTQVVSPVLDVSTLDSPDPVTMGNDVQYTLKVTNNGIATVPDAHVFDTIPAGTTLKTSTQPNDDPCSGTGPVVDCSLGSLAVGEFVEAKIVVTVPNATGTITNSAVASPGNNTPDTETTGVIDSPPGEASGFVTPGDTIVIDPVNPGDPNPVELTLPPDTDGAPVIITQGPGTFCDGPCTGPTTTISAFPGYDDPNAPIHVTISFVFEGITAAADSYGAAVWKNTDPLHPEDGSVVPSCDTLHAGVANPSPCVDGRTISEPILGEKYIVSFDINYLSGDPKFGTRTKTG
jgi:uncharacterized repeat protein (TIGR01451 family)